MRPAKTKASLPRNSLRGSHTQSIVDDEDPYKNLGTILYYVATHASFLASGDFYRLLITVAKSLDTLIVSLTNDFL